MIYLPTSDVLPATATWNAGGLVRTHSLLVVHHKFLFALMEVCLTTIGGIDSHGTTNKRFNKEEKHQYLKVLQSLREILAKVTLLIIMATTACTVLQRCQVFKFFGALCIPQTAELL